jgi:hypothetical protein
VLGVVDQDEQLSEAEERAEALAAAAEMKEVVSWFFKPSKPVPNGSTARCFFDRASAEVKWLSADPSSEGLLGVVDQDEQLSEAEERAEALAAAAEMKEVISWFLHPELPVPSTVPGRCFFGRASAPEQETLEASAARALALADVAEQREVAAWFMAPGKPVLPSIPARCYYGRASAEPRESFEEAEQRAEALQVSAARGAQHICAALTRSATAGRRRHEGRRQVVHAARRARPFLCSRQVLLRKGERPRAGDVRGGRGARFRARRQRAHQGHHVLVHQAGCARAQGR